MASHPLSAAGYSKSFVRDWTSHFGKRRLELFERAVHDPNLVSLRAEIAKIDLRISEIESEALENETASNWKDVRELVATLASELDSKANPVPDLGAIREMVLGLKAVTERGPSKADVWRQILPLIQERRKLAEAERRYEELHDFLIPAAALGLLFDDLHGVLDRSVSDKTTRLNIIQDLITTFHGTVRARTVGREVSLELPAKYQAALAATVAPGNGAESESHDGVREGLPQDEAELPHIRPPRGV
jgi:hypothetical protein